MGATFRPLLLCQSIKLVSQLEGIVQLYTYHWFRTKCTIDLHATLFKKHLCCWIIDSPTDYAAIDLINSLECGKQLDVAVSSHQRLKYYVK